ncbi:MAG: 30S ribosomal protein S12 methylthiotransferase accessory factor YcaO [Candidatus Dactylopiibacterium sp.]|nr:30S ribosomal protein S12 methylthiotransferase accessory factor YcaO [Candidatus Dactylopiibacterium sp.]
MSAPEHVIAGKDALLETTISQFQARLADIGFQTEESGWLNPVEGVWSVHLRDADCPLLHAHGKGASQLAARASALGEFVERLASNDFWADYYLGETQATARFAHDPRERWFATDDAWEWPDDLLTPGLQAFYNPAGEIDAEALVDFNTGNLARGICTLPCQRLSDGQTIWMPVNIIANLYLSNGAAAGNTPAEARVQALSEILARHVQFRVIREGLCLPDVPADVVARCPAIAAGLAGLRAAGFAIRVRDASLGGQFPVVSIALLNPRDQGVRVSFAAHPRFEVALERALAGLLQGRALATLGGLPPASHDLEDVASVSNTETHFTASAGAVHWNFLGAEADFAFHDWNFAGSTQQAFDQLAAIVHAAGHDILILDFTHLGVCACRILVPGLSEIHPLDELDFDNNSVGNDLRPSILSLQDLSDEECAELLEALNDIDIDEHKPVAALIGLAPDPGTLWADLRVGELKCLIALAIGHEEGMEAGLRWVADVTQIAPDRRRVYACIEDLLRLDDHERYMAALLDLYGETRLDQALRTLAGELRFFGTPSPGLRLEGCVLHGKLLEAYAKVQRLR